MRNSIKQDIQSFLQGYPSMNAFALARAAEVAPSVISRVLRGKTQDILSRNADKLRAAMHRLESEANREATAETPTGRGEVNRGND